MNNNALRPQNLSETEVNGPSKNMGSMKESILLNETEKTSFLTSKQVDLQPEEHSAEAGRMCGLSLFDTLWI